jgi:hypothetical protein
MQSVIFVLAALVLAMHTVSAVTAEIISCSA